MADFILYGGDKVIRLSSTLTHLTQSIKHSSNFAAPTQKFTAFHSRERRNVILTKKVFYVIAKVHF